MELLNYLNQYFYTREQLLDISQISDEQLKQWQSDKIMPQASYRLNIQLDCDSFFGLSTQHQQVEYYAKGYISWIGILSTGVDAKQVFALFSQRYEARLDQLQQQGFSNRHDKLNQNFNTHILQEWQSFLDGTYGLCTKSGLPEDIAAKELAIIIINQLIEHPSLSTAQLSQLEQAINLLDNASALFAPHERKTSSRQRLVNELRRKYGLRASL
ncbi:DUF6058 family natural product biosynthesis protein [Neptunicella sp. SCSIO 80796]|uniref:DUF6058 family natural product biosynthesis protein n=1 Tax=Neptunicella plasticusilytica TaxID=3117012 RepID=UPI003A4D6356